MRQSPFSCKYCMAAPISSSISFTTWLSVTVVVSLFENDAGSLPPPCKQDIKCKGRNVN
ncbi:hypothetical protein Hanom_Chr05g00403461 [Helianthus anomalus]